MLDFTYQFILFICLLQHKDDPLFAEFIEAHTNEKTSWIKNAFVEATKSDDDDSGVEDEVQEKAVDKSKSDKVVEESKTEMPEKRQQKIANKQISDLEVLITLILLCIFVFI